MTKQFLFFLCLVCMQQTHAQVDFSATVNGRSVFFQKTSQKYQQDYFWTYGDGNYNYGLFLDTITHEYAAFGKYNVCLVASGSIGVNDTMCKTIDLVSTYIAEEKDLNTHTDAYFTDNMLVIELLNKDGVVAVYDMQGRLCFKTGNSGRQYINTFGWDKGIYVVAVQMDNAYLRFRVVKE